MSDDLHPLWARFDNTHGLWYTQTGGIPHEIDCLRIVHEMVDQLMIIYFFEAFILLHSYDTHQNFLCYGTQIDTLKFIDITNSPPQEAVNRISRGLEGPQVHLERLE